MLNYKLLKLVNINQTQIKWYTPQHICAYVCACVCACIWGRAEFDEKGAGIFCSGQVRAGILFRYWFEAGVLWAGQCCLEPSPGVLGCPHTMCEHRHPMGRRQMEGGQGRRGYLQRVSGGGAGGAQSSGKGLAGERPGLGSDPARHLSWHIPQWPEPWLWVLSLVKGHWGQCPLWSMAARARDPLCTWPCAWQGSLSCGGWHSSVTHPGVSPTYWLHDLGMPVNLPAWELPHLQAGVTTDLHCCAFERPEQQGCSEPCQMPCIASTGKRLVVLRSSSD